MRGMLSSMLTNANRAHACYLVLAIVLSFPALAETITAATYNVELFHEHFAATTQPIAEPEVARRVRADADKDLWMISRVILDPKFNPDILVIEECCEQDELDRFNRDWLHGAYETVIVFPTN